MSLSVLGSKHKTMVEARNGAGPIKSYPRPGSRLKMQNGSKGSGLQNKTFHCEICDVHVNSEIQLKQVMYSELVVIVVWGHHLTVYLLIYIMVLTVLKVKFTNLYRIHKIYKIQVLCGRKSPHQIFAYICQISD